MDEQEARYRQQSLEFPQSPLPHFSLGRHLLQLGRYAEAVPPLEEANRLQGDWAAALVALGDAYRGAARIEDARQTFDRARRIALAQNHPSLAEEIDERLADM